MIAILVGLAALGLLCVIANLLAAIGKIVIGLLRYIIGPAVLFLMVMMLITWIARGGH